jgi:hypothetical protein
VIYFVTYAEGRHSVAMLLAGWGRGRLNSVRRFDYRALFRRQHVPLGSYVFTGLEHLTNSELEQTARVWNALRSASDDVLLCNHPLRVLRRYPLLRVLNEKGINAFNAYRLDEFRTPRRFPVFLRRADDHLGPRSELLNNLTDLELSVTAFIEKGVCLNDWIVTEFSQTREEDGLYRKYGAFLINGQIIPRHLHVSRHWMVKRAGPETTAKTIDEEWAYVNDNPHAVELRKIFAAAQTDYGRIDYTIDEGRLRVFEINTNPQILNPGESREAARNRVKRLFAERFIDALRKMAAIEHPATRVRVDYGRPPLLKRRPKFTELMIRLTNRLGLKRFEPYIYRGLIEFRKLWN